MQQLIEAARAALEALSTCNSNEGDDPWYDAAKVRAAKEALRAALDAVQEQPGDLIEAAERYATNYHDDPRQDIKADVMNAFFAGSKFGGAAELALNRAWLAENGPGRWIDDLRNEVARLKTALDAAVQEQPEQVAWQISDWDEVDGWGGWSHIGCADVGRVQEWVERNQSTRRLRPLYTHPPQPVAVPADTRALIEQCRAALAEELAAWDIDPPLHHVKQAHDACVAWLAAAPAAPQGEKA